MNSLNGTIGDLMRASDIAATESIYAEIVERLVDMGLNLAFFVFKNSAHSSAARTLEDGSIKSVPSIMLFLRYDEDYRQIGIDPQQGNWRDGWVHTDTVRKSINVILEKHRYGDDYVSDRTYVFLTSLEGIAFYQIGSASKDAIHTLVSHEVHLEPKYICWSSGREYHIIMRNKKDYQRVNETMKQQILKAVPDILAAADTGRYCQNYQVEIAWAYVGMKGLNLYGLSRED